MTPIRFTSPPRWRESQTITREKGRIRTIVVALEPDALLIRPKGVRTAYRLPFSLAYLAAVQRDVDLRRAERGGRRRKGVQRGKA